MTENDDFLDQNMDIWGLNSSQNNRNLILSNIIVMLLFLMVFFGSNAFYGWSWEIDIDQLSGFTL